MEQEDRDMKVQDDDIENVEAEQPGLDEVGQLKLLLEQQKEENQKIQDNYIRSLAEMDNLRRRMAREKEEYIKYAAMPAIKKMLPVLDDFDRALLMSKNNSDYESLSKGVEMISRNMHEIIKNEGVIPIEAQGQEFNPQYHEPLIVESSEEHPDNTVIEELQKGYVMHGRVIRPSLVKVSGKSLE